MMITEKGKCMKIIFAQLLPDLLAGYVIRIKNSVTSNEEFRRHFIAYVEFCSYKIDTYIDTCFQSQSVIVSIP